MPGKLEPDANIMYSSQPGFEPSDEKTNSHHFNKMSAETSMERDYGKPQLQETDEVVGYKTLETITPDGRAVMKRYKVVKRPRTEYVWLTREEKREIGVDQLQ